MLRHLIHMRFFFALAAMIGFVGMQAPARAECDTIYIGTELVDDVTWCASSILPPSNVATYRPRNLDRWNSDLSQAWCEGASGNGIGEWFEFRSRPGTTIRTITIFNGYQKSRKSFFENARARDIRLVTDSGLKIRVALKDRMGAQEIKLQNWHDLRYIRVEIESVYPGSKYNDLCLSAFGINFEERREYEWQQMQK